MKTAFLFPGQGAQFPGMAKDLHEASPAVREYFQAASDVLGRDLAKLMFEGSEDELKITENTQAAVTLHNISAARVLQERGVVADLCAGFSVGEYAALFHAGVLSLQDLFTLVKWRGAFMEEASRLADSPAGPSAMSAILGLTKEQAIPVLEPLAAQGVFLANHSSLTQIVIAGTAEGLEAAEKRLQEAGAMKVVRLKVSGPFHSPLLAAAADKFAVAIAPVRFNEPKIPLLSNVTGNLVTNAREAKELAPRQIMSPVRWVDSMELIVAQGAERVLETGPGKVLSGLWRGFTRDRKCLPMGTMAEILALE